MSYLSRAIKDGYANITGTENKQKIAYVTSDDHTENYNDPDLRVCQLLDIILRTLDAHPDWDDEELAENIDYG